MSGAPQALVSIVVPTYNRVGTLEHALRSACAQTHTRLEIIVCDDAGTQDVEGLIRAIGDPRIRYLRSDVNTMKAGLFAEGLREARGAYLMELDDDDFLAPECVATLVEPLERDPDLALSFGDHWIARPDGTVDESRSDENTLRWGRASLAAGKHAPFIDLALVSQAVCMNVCGMVRRSCVDLRDFPARVEGLSDYWLGYLACRDGAAAWYCGQRLSYYREHEGNFTHVRSDARFSSRSFVFDSMLRDDRLATIRAHLRRELHANEVSYSVWLLESGRLRDARARARRVRKAPGGPTVVPAALEVLGMLPALGPMAIRSARRVVHLRRSARHSRRPGGRAAEAH